MKIIISLERLKTKNDQLSKLHLIVTRIIMPSFIYYRMVYSRYLWIEVMDRRNEIQKSFASNKKRGIKGIFSLSNV